MSKARIFLLTLTCTGLLATALPAGAEHGGTHPTFREERTYINCAGPTKVENANLPLSGPPDWDTTPPAQSATEGGGCGALDPGALRGGNPQTIYDAVFRGLFQGNLRDLTFELHNLVLSQVRTGETFRVRVRMLIDGVEIFPETEGVFVDVTPELSETGISEKFLFSVTGLGCAREILDEDGNVVDVVRGGLATQDGDGSQVRDIQIAIDSFFIDRASAWVWDATEVPSGITFNPDELAEAQVPASNPAIC
jgi:hypothetical protein